MSARVIRLPLQVGSSSANALARAGATLVPGLAMTAGAIPLYLASSLVAAILCGVIGVQLLLLGVLSARRAARVRPSDALLTAEGLRFEGGPHDGRELRWDQIDPGRCSLVEEEIARLTLTKIIGNLVFWTMSILASDELESAPPDKVTVHRLELDGETLAEADTPDEQRSLEALHESILARAARDGGEEKEISQQVLRCSSCAAPLVPDDGETVACAYCAAENPLPGKLRERVRAARDIERNHPRSVALVTRLLDQPGAGRANAVLALMALLMLIAWPAALVTAGLALGLGLADAGFEIGWLAANGIVFCLAVFFVLRFGLVDRGALRLLTLGFAARAPATPDKPHGCRSCGGPLVAAAGQLLARCVFCDADNVLGIDPRHRARAERSQKRSLEEALQLRSKRRRRWLVAALVGLLAAAIAVAFASVSVGEVLIANAEPADCKAGDLTACARVGEKYAYGKGVESDYKLAAWALEKACEGEDARACGILAGLYADSDWGLPKDLKRWRAWSEKACKGGYAVSCGELKRAP